MPPPVRLLVLATAVGAIVAAVLLAQGPVEREPFASRGTPAEPLPEQCLPLPAEKPLPKWLPDDLPIPAGSYAVREVSAPAGDARRVLLVVRAPLDQVKRLVREDWQARGWRLGRSEAEPGEAEASFAHTDGRYGSFRARSVYCDAQTTELALLLGRRSP